MKTIMDPNLDIILIKLNQVALKFYVFSCAPQLHKMVYDNAKNCIN